MARIDPTLLRVVADVARGLRALGVPFGIVGALVPELLLDARPARMTNDADVMVVVQTLEQFDGLKDQLARYGFERTRLAHRLRHASGGVLDLLPYSASIAPGERLQLDEDTIFNMAGFRHVVPCAVAITVEGGPSLPVAPLPLYVLLKLVAFSDRRAPKDLGSVLHCLEHYLEDDERRYGVEHEGAGAPYEYTCARLVRRPGRPARGHRRGRTGESLRGRRSARARVRVVPLVSTRAGYRGGRRRRVACDTPGSRGL